MFRRSLAGTAAAVCAFAAARPAAWGQEKGALRRADLIQMIQIQGTIKPVNKIQIRALHDGRIEEVKAGANTWAHGNAPLGYEIAKEFAILLDSNRTTREDVLRERWKSVFQPVPLQCASDCFVLSAPAKPKTWVQGGEVVFEVASALRLEGMLSPRLAQWQHPEFELEVWPASDPSHRQWLGVESISDNALTALIPFGSDLTPGTPCKGRLKVTLKKNTFIVPSSALIRYRGSTYLPVQVTPGLVTERETEILWGVYDGQFFLNLNADRSAASAKQDPAKASLPHLPAEEPASSPQPPQQKGP